MYLRTFVFFPSLANSCAVYSFLLVLIQRSHLDCSYQRTAFVNQAICSRGPHPQMHLSLFVIYLCFTLHTFSPMSSYPCSICTSQEFLLEFRQCFETYDEFSLLDWYCTMTFRLSPCSIWIGLHWFSERFIAQVWYQ